MQASPLTGNGAMICSARGRLAPDTRMAMLVDHSPVERHAIA